MVGIDILFIYYLLVVDCSFINLFWGGGEGERTGHTVPSSVARSGRRTNNGDQQWVTKNISGLLINKWLVGRENVYLFSCNQLLSSSLNKLFAFSSWSVKKMFSLYMLEVFKNLFVTPVRGVQEFSPVSILWKLFNFSKISTHTLEYYKIVPA